MKVGEQTFTSRFTMRGASGASYTFTLEASPDGANWTAMMDGANNKSRQKGAIDSGRKAAAPTGGRALWC